jgi:hypothetical protein
MRTAVINFSGNVGKSTLARHLLAPRMPNTKVIAVETINADSASELNVKGSDFGHIQESLQFEEKIIIDVGASNVEDFLALMRRYRGSHTDFDLFVVPTVPAPKQQRDTLECIKALIQIGVDPYRIVVIFNQVDPQIDLQTIFDPIFKFAAASGACMVSELATVWQSDLFALIRGTNESLQDIINDPRDLKAQIRCESDMQVKVELVRRLSIQRLALGVQENLDLVFTEIEKCIVMQ